MTRDRPGRYSRRSIRLDGYDYRQPGAYFVTICTQGSECLFGEVVDGRTRLNVGGEMVWRWWQELNAKFPPVRTDAAVVMPNHFHGIIFIVGQPHRVAPTDGPRRGDAPTLGEIIGWFKTMTTNEYIRGAKELGWPPFPGKVWQRNYYERIIRNREELERIRSYIQTNPERWALDRNNPNGSGVGTEESWFYGSGEDPLV